MYLPSNVYKNASFGSSHTLKQLLLPIVISMKLRYEYIPVSYSDFQWAVFLSSLILLEVVGILHVEEEEQRILDTSEVDASDSD